jgi:hypothetical protein
VKLALSIPPYTSSQVPSTGPDPISRVLV